MRLGEAHLPSVRKDNLTSPGRQRGWTNPDAYLGAMARKRSFRRARQARPRTQPDQPRPFLSTVPFLAVIALLGVLAVAIMVLAFPGAQPQTGVRSVARHEAGVAERGWFQEAQKEMRR